MPADPITTSRTERDAKLAQAHAAHREGRLADASAIYRELVGADETYLPAIHGLGLVTNDLGYPERALPLLARCIAAEPDNVGYRISVGMVALNLGRAEAAAVALLPAANATPMRMEARLLLARALGALGRWQEAYTIMVETTAVFPEVPELWSWRGRAAREIGRPGEAEKSWRQALALAPADPEILNNLGVMLRSQRRFQEAAEAYRAALAVAPDNAVMLRNLGNALGELSEETEAEIHLRRAIALDPDSIDGLYNLGAHLVRFDHPEDAIPVLRRVLARDPKRWDALTNLGVALVALGDLTEAEICYRQALALNAGNPEAHYDLAWLLLLTGRWPEGWAEYEWRWEMPTFSSRKRTFPAPLWDGKPVKGTLLIHAEQGLGDAIQFVRYARAAAPLCDRLVIEAPRVLVALFRRATETGLLPGDVIAFREPLPEIAAHAPFMSLPRLFGTTPETIPAATAYLAAPVGSPLALSVPRRGKRLIGLVWAGSPENRIDRQRSIDPSVLRPLLDAIDADFISLQAGPAAARRPEVGEGFVFDIAGVVGDFADTAAVIDQLDLVIGVDTAVLHLAGALGKRAWMMLPAAPDYRWLAAGETTAWYPSLRIFRQSTRGDWPGVIDAVAEALRAW